MNPYLNYHIAQDRQAEILRQAKENRQFDQRMNQRVKQLSQAPFVALMKLATILHTIFEGLLPEQTRDSSDLQHGASQ